MNGEVNQTMEDVERMPLANLENSQQILDKIVIHSVDPEAFSDIASVNPEIQEEIVQISALKSVESEEISKNTFNSENQKEIKEYSINSQESDKVVETKTVDFDNRNKNVKITDYEDLDEHKDTREIYTADSEGSVEVTKIPFTIVDTTKEIIKTPLVVSEKSEELREVVLTYSEEPEETLKIPFQNTEGAKEIIEISLADSEESEKNIDTPLVNSDDSKQSIDLEDVENEDHVIQIATTKSLNDTYNDTSQEDVINGNTEDYETDYSDGIRSKVTTIEIIQLPDSEFTSNDVESPNCSNSNGSFAESMASSQTKSETTNQQPIDTVNENSNNYLKSENDSQHSEDDGDLDEIIDADVSEEELKTTDTGSINSDTEPKIPINEVSSRDNETKVNTSENITVEGEQKEVSNENQDDTSIPEINSQLPEDPIPLRRSSRAIKRKRYTDDLENVEEYEIGIEDSQRHKSRPMGVNHTKIRIEMSATSTRFNQGNRQKVFIDCFSERTPPAKGSGYSTHSNQNTHYNMYVPRNTNTCLNRTNTVANNSSQTPSILPSLTDDMYVVEAPSFIVPYVYEKPSMVPFREFVESLGEELKEQRAKDIESLEKHKDIECNNKNNKVTHENSEGSGDEEKSQLKKKKESNKEKRRIKNDDDDASWNGESTTESEEDIISDEEDKISILKDKGYSVDQMNRSSGGAPAKTVIPNKSDSYFDCSLGNFFMSVGNNLVQEYVQNDLLKQENRKLYKAKKLGHNTKGTETSIISLKKNLELSKYNNAPYALQLKKCPFCTFKSESNLILAHHLEAPHVKNNIYKCNLCSFEVKTPLDILNHMEGMHGVSGRLERSPACHQCPNCTFEDNSKGKLARHIISCMKKFKPETNLSPPFDWEPPAKIPKISKARNSMVPSYQNTFGRGQISNSTVAPIYPNNMKSATIGSLYRIQTPTTVNATPKLVPVHGVPIMRNTVMLRHNAPVANSSNFNVKQKSMHQPSISITPLPRQPQPVQSQQTNLKNTFVICEICDGYIKDLEQLRNHMQSIHKVKIHPKMIYNRPPLNCQKCQFRFFTDQGLERHLLGSHGLVTSSMQEAANRGKDAGRCPVCGRVYQWKLLNHVARDHNLSLKPAHLSYKCTVCAATFGMYKQFENHVYSAHSVVARRVIDKSKAPAPQNKSHGNSASLYKPVKINDEITIIPQTTKSKDK